MKTKRLLAALLACIILFAGCSNDNDNGREDQLPAYSISVAGTVSGSGDTSISVNGVSAAEAEEGAQVTLTATPADGYLFRKWTVVSGDVAISDKEANPAMFIMPVGNVVIKAEFESEPLSIAYTITIADDGNGTAAAGVSAGADNTWMITTSAKRGMEVALAACPADGYLFREWTVVSGEVALSDNEANPAMFIMPAGNVEIRAGFRKDPIPRYTITFTDDDKGIASASVNGAVIYSVKEGEEVTLTAFPNRSYYLFHKWTVVSGDVVLSDENANPATFIMPAGNVEIRAEFEEELDIFNEITDPCLLTYCRRFDTNRNGRLSPDEALAVTKIDLSGEGILDVVSLAGIEHFTNLEYLNCGRSQLSGFDVSMHRNLSTLMCYGIRLTSLDVSNNPELTYLDCSENQLTDIDVSNNPKLRTLSCMQNRLFNIDVSNNPNLTGLNVSWNPNLTNLDVSRNPNLRSLECRDNQFTSLDVSNNPELAYFYCENNQLKSLDISSCSKLARLKCDNNTYLSVIYVWDSFDIDNPDNNHVIIWKDDHTSFVKK